MELSTGAHWMKIDDANQQMAAAHLLNARVDRHDPQDAHTDSATKPQQAADKVDLSGVNTLGAAEREQQAQRAQRVQELKAMVAAGEYNVSSRAVAEKMLSKIVLRPVH